MSATPEQIAERLKGWAQDAEGATKAETAVPTASGFLISVPSANGFFALAADLRAAASLIRAQSERERVLVEALRAFERADDADASEEYADLMNAANEKMRAALKAAP
jgi:hypothetical protein